MANTWISTFGFEAQFGTEIGAEITQIPPNATLENVLMPPNPSFDDPFGGSWQVEFDYGGKRHTATMEEFAVAGACYQRSQSK